MVLHKLDGSSEIRLVELIWNIPSDWSELSSLLHCGVEEGNSVKCRFPLWQVVDIQLILKHIVMGKVKHALNVNQLLVEELL